MITVSLRLSHVVAIVLAAAWTTAPSLTNAQSAASAARPVLAGKLERIKIHGASLEGNLLGETASPEVSIYLPPSYAREPSRRYPVVYMLHGYTNSDLGYFGPEGRQADVIAERVFAAGARPPSRISSRGARSFPRATFRPSFPNPSHAFGWGRTRISCITR